MLDYAANCAWCFRQTREATIFPCGAPVLDLSSWPIWRVERLCCQIPIQLVCHCLWTSLMVWLCLNRSTTDYFSVTYKPLSSLNAVYGWIQSPLAVKIHVQVLTFKDFFVQCVKWRKCYIVSVVYRTTMDLLYINCFKYLVKMCIFVWYNSFCH